MEEIIEKYKTGELTRDEFIDEISKLKEDSSTLTYDDLAAVERSFNALFTKSVDIMTRKVRAGGTSSNIYVPRRYKGYPITVIIWDKEKFDRGLNTYYNEEEKRNPTRYR